jgi:hypothetical protein
MKIDNDPAIIYGITITIGVVGAIIGTYKYYKSNNLTEEEKNEKLRSAARGEKTVLSSKIEEDNNFSEIDSDQDSISDTSSMFDGEMDGGDGKKSSKNKKKMKAKTKKPKKSNKTIKIYKKLI